MAVLEVVEGLVLVVQEADRSSGGVRASDTSGAGGSGVVIIAYADSFNDLSAVGGGLTVNGSAGNTTPNTDRSGYKVYVFTAGTGDITF
mgnify:CR=1 FL=1